jgi:hypothetical protein
MPGFLMHLGSSAKCPHGTGQTAVIASNPKVMVLFTSNVATVADLQSVVGCLFQVPAPTPSGTKPQPCASVKFIPSTKVLILGQAAIVAQIPPVGNPPSGVCQTIEQIPQLGSPVIVSVQSKVIAL